MCRKAKPIVGFSQKKGEESRTVFYIRRLPDISRSIGLIKIDRSKNNALGLRGRVGGAG